MIVTIDGPAASGKSVVAQRLAQRLGSVCLNTGAMYRAVGMLALKQCGSLDDSACVERVAKSVRLDFNWTTDPPQLLIDGTPADRELASEAVANAASRVARFPGVRAILVEQQARIGRDRGDLVTEGRDQGSVVFPDSPVKFYLTADVRVRARRRYEQLVRRGLNADEDIVLSDLQRRDEQDTTSPVGRLVVPDDAVVIDTSALNDVESVVNRMFGVIQERRVHR